MSQRIAGGMDGGRGGTGGGGGDPAYPTRQQMKLPINWPWHRVCTESNGGALSMRGVSLTPCASVSEKRRKWWWLRR